jgi:ferredoxin
MNVRVDEDLCIGCELCVQTAPAIFEMSGNKAITKTKSVSSDNEASCKDASDSCPVSAIIIEE